ncbi:MAG TPA: NADH-quinone oxidoreductase subunit NuoH [Phycisphaerae bacterium]|nr:NADH-quinone oxidoreductase subunit NuoH [Phycisphaerae bacterium]
MSVPWEHRRPVQYRASARFIIALATVVYRVAAPIVRAVPGPILLTAVALSVLASWGCMGLFGVVDDIAASTANTEATSFAGLTLTVAEIDVWLVEHSVPAAGAVKYLLWVLQSEIVRDLIAVTGILILFNIIPVYAIWWERKVAGRIQSRLGPMRAGCWHGWAQSFADGVKLIIKEDLVPGGADKPLFLVAPYFAFAPAFLAFCALPLGTYWVFRNVDVALLLVLGMLGVEVVSVIVGGWASNNKWSVYGAMREACQMVSYEVPMGLALLVPVMTAGSLNLVVIGEAQSGGWHTWAAFHNPFAFVAFVVYFICSLASCKRAPFDLPEAESELVAGFHTEYSGFRWAMFFFAEYAAMFVVSALCVTLFLGAWHSPLPQSWALESSSIWAKGLNGILFSGPVWFLFKCVFFLYVQLWLRWTLPRIRIDQVLHACVQVILPIALVTLLGHALWMLWFPAGSIVYAIVNVLLSIVGVCFLGVAVGIAAYGFANRRRLIGYLAVDHLPGS